jgi:hypothetical protein
MQVQSTTLIDRPSAAPADTINDLTYGELAVVLAASCVMPKHFRAASDVQLRIWAAEGLAVLGLELAWFRDWRTRYIVSHDAYAATAEGCAEYAAIWPFGERAKQRCHDAAFRLANFGISRQMVNVLVPTNEPGISYSFRVAARDLEFGMRYPERTATDRYLSGLLLAYTLKD